MRDCFGCGNTFPWPQIDAVMEVREAERDVYLCRRCLRNVLTYLSTLKDVA